jgi:hypothetical protein
LQPASFPIVVRFDVFELDLRARELRKNGANTGLPHQSVKILAMLLEHQGEVVLREDIRKKPLRQTHGHSWHLMAKMRRRQGSLVGAGAESRHWKESMRNEFSPKMKRDTIAPAG